MSIKTPLAKAKGLGSAKDGVGHWIAQRITAIALIPLVFLFVKATLKVALTSDEKVNFISLFHSPYYTISVLLLITVGIYHGSLGIRVVIEDYVHCKCGKKLLLILVNFISVVSALAGILAILKIHLGS